MRSQRVLVTFVKTRHCTSKEVLVHATYPVLNHHCSTAFSPLAFVRALLSPSFSEEESYSLTPASLSSTFWEEIAGFTITSNNALDGLVWLENCQPNFRWLNLHSSLQLQTSCRLSLVGQWRFQTENLQLSLALLGAGSYNIFCLKSSGSSCSKAG